MQDFGLGGVEEEDSDICPNSDQKVTYFCFTCENQPPICSECVIHGEHRGCEVMLLKKAQPYLSQKVSEFEMQINGRLEEVDIQEKRLEGHRRDLIE